VKEIREEYLTSLLRGAGTAVLAGALVFFNLWPQDVTIQVLISSTMIAALTPLGAFLGLGVRDAQRNDKL